MFLYVCGGAGDGGGGGGGVLNYLALIGNPYAVDSASLRTNEQIVESSRHPNSFECFGIILRWLPRSDF